jgi:glycosyltransferase involved in cell wall biosynthesis
LKSNEPLVSIGLPVHNGENFVTDAVNSILSQSYTNIELIISDNASVDCTEEICREFCKKDFRIKYYRNQENIGAVPNFNKVFNLAKGKYFKWAAHDDVISPEYIAKCMQVLERESDVVLCQTKVVIINATGQPIERIESSMRGVCSTKPHIRFQDLLLRGIWTFEIFGLIRSEILRSIEAMGCYPGSDKVMRAELGLIGKIVEVPEYLFYSRDHIDRSIRSMRSRHERAVWINPKNVNKTILPHWIILREYILLINRSPLKEIEKLKCYLLLFRWLGLDKNWLRMMLDVVFAIEPKLLGLFYRNEENVYGNFLGKIDDVKEENL